MTLPTIRHGFASNGKHYAEFIPEGMINTIRIYGETQDEATEGAFEFLDEYDVARRAAHIKHSDPVENPAHYTRFPVEVITITENLNFCRGNAVKYICRAGAKNPDLEVQDLQKALWYLEREIARLRAS